MLRINRIVHSETRISRLSPPRLSSTRHDRPGAGARKPFGGGAQQRKAFYDLDIIYQHDGAIALGDVARDVGLQTWHLLPLLGGRQRD